MRAPKTIRTAPLCKACSLDIAPLLGLDDISRNDAESAWTRTLYRLLGSMHIVPKACAPPEGERPRTRSQLPLRVKPGPSGVSAPRPLGRRKRNYRRHSAIAFVP